MGIIKDLLAKRKAKNELIEHMLEKTKQSFRDCELESMPVGTKVSEFMLDGKEAVARINKDANMKAAKQFCKRKV